LLSFIKIKRPSASRLEEIRHEGHNHFFIRCNRDHEGGDYIFKTHNNEMKGRIMYSKGTKIPLKGRINVLKGLIFVGNIKQPGKTIRL
jgi:UDP-2,3-diacylglucosamine pyrophosphatase LpxH